MSTTRTGIGSRTCAAPALILVKRRFAGDLQRFRVASPQDRERRHDGQADDYTDLLGAFHDGRINPFFVPEPCDSDRQSRKESSGPSGQLPPAATVGCIFPDACAIATVIVRLVTCQCADGTAPPAELDDESGDLGRKPLIDQGCSFCHTAHISDRRREIRLPRGGTSSFMNHLPTSWGRLHRFEPSTDCAAMDGVESEGNAGVAQLDIA